MYTFTKRILFYSVPLYSIILKTIINILIITIIKQIILWSTCIFCIAYPCLQCMDLPHRICAKKDLKQSRKEGNKCL